MMEKIKRQVIIKPEIKKNIPNRSVLFIIKILRKVKLNIII